MRVGLLGSLVAVIAVAPASAIPCAADRVPAASVLIPYFEVDVANCAAASSRSTRVSLLNVLQAPILVNVVLWSDLSVPVWSFNVYLAGLDSQSFDLRQLLCNGTLPSTGSAVAPETQFADPPVTFPNCNTTATPPAPPVYGGAGAIPPGQRAALRTWLAGKSASGTCAGFDHGDQIARGFVTIDSVNECTVGLDPEDPGYLSILTGDNALVADAQVTLDDGIVRAMDGVQVEADAAVFTGGPDTTFWSRFGLGDFREPLPTTFSAHIRPLDRVVVWREAGPPAEPFACAALPPWYPLEATNQTGSGPLVLLDESGALRALPADTFPLATQTLDAGASPLLVSGRSTFYANLQPGQAWVQVLSPGKTARDAAALDSSCDNAPFTWTSPGPPPILFPP